MSGLRPLSESVARLAKGTFSRKFVSLGRILSSWDEIVGPGMAGLAQPVKLHYRKPKNAGDAPQASLDIAVSSADATALHYQKDLILERLNQIFGERWITSIRFVHMASNTNADEGYNRPQPALSLSDQAAVREMISNVEDEEIRNRLEKLGQGVLRKRNKILSPTRKNS